MSLLNQCLFNLNHIHISIFSLTEYTNPSADGFSGSLVVSRDHDDADSGVTAFGDRRHDFLAGRVQHAHDTNECGVDL